MHKYETQVLVIGGGATGTGIIRDVAMRGFDAILVEKSDLSTGTSGRYHGLLHSGGRYVIRDLETAKECIEENIILRRIMPNCIEDTGGFFVQTPEDDPAYADSFIEGCKKANIPIEEIKINEMLREEPLLNPNIQRCFRVPDGSADSFLAAKVNIQSAIQHGAKILKYHEVSEMIIENHQVKGIKCHDILNDQIIEIYAEIVVNASGAWAGKIAKLAGIDVHVISGKGTMIAMNHRIVNTVINRCKKPSDGDILVPAHTVSIMGTTDVQVPDPDHFSIEPWEVNLLLNEGNVLIPGFKDMRILRAWAGVRPLYQETNVDDTREVTRSFVLLDHAQQGGIDGFITITSGKWTTYRRMAEVTVDLVCDKLGIKRECRTHLEILPESEEKKYHHLGSRLSHIEKNKLASRLICECELVTYDDVKTAIFEDNAKSIDDIRRSTRVGMGPCQGGYCSLRIAGILHRLRQPSIDQTNVMLYDFLQERWKGLLPILWGQQLRQERLDELIYLSVLNADHLPGERKSPISPTLYQEPNKVIEEIQIEIKDEKQRDIKHNIQETSLGGSTDTLVIGSGLAGLTAALISAKNKKKTNLISKGMGTLYWHAGCIDLIGYSIQDSHELIHEPIRALETIVNEFPNHPYALIGIHGIEKAINELKELSQKKNYPLIGSLESNWILPSSLGAKRPTCLAPTTMISGDLSIKEPMLIIGFNGYFDFYPELIADNISSQGIRAKGIMLEIESLKDVKNINTITMAKKFEDPSFRHEVIQAIKEKMTIMSDFSPKRIGFPAIFGIENSITILEDLRDKLDLPIFEIPTLPPSVPGIRLSNLLQATIISLGGKVNIGLEAIGSETSTDPTSNNQKIDAVWTEAAARKVAHHAKAYILATGGILGGGLFADYSGRIIENIFDLAINNPNHQTKWFQREFLSKHGHPIFKTGIQINYNFQPIDLEGKPFFENLFIAGTTIDGFDFLRERSYDGVALVTGYTLGSKL
jgi:glycerol-3-phosphate dehydrogenase